MRYEIKSLIAICLFCSTTPAFAQSNLSQQDRLKLMDQQMSCIENSMHKGVSWNDLCVLSDTNAQPTMGNDSIASSQSQGDQTAAPKDAVLQNWNTYTTAGSSATPLVDSDLYKEHQFQIDEETSGIFYHESSVGMKENGPFFGIDGSYDWRPEDAQNWIMNVFHADGHINLGIIDYKSPDATVSDVLDVLIEPRVWIGRDFTPFNNTRLTPYIGFGYRYLFDHLGKASDIGGYDRMSNYIYLPLGIQWANTSIAGWEFIVDPEFDIFLHGWQTSYLSNITGSYPNLTNDQTKGYGLRFSFDVIKKMQNVNLVFSPYVRYWNIHQSKTATAFNTNSQIEVVGYEPANTSVEAGMKVGLQF